MSGRAARTPRTSDAETRYAVVIYPAWGGPVRVPINPICNPGLAHDVAHLLRSFLSYDDVRYEAAPQWAFALRDRLAGRLKGVRVEVEPISFTPQRAGSAVARLAA